MAIKYLAIAMACKNSTKPRTCHKTNMNSNTDKKKSQKCRAKSEDSINFKNIETESMRENTHPVDSTKGGRSDAEVWKRPDEKIVDGYEKIRSQGLYTN